MEMAKQLGSSDKTPLQTKSFKPLILPIDVRMPIFIRMRIRTR